MNSKTKERIIKLIIYAIAGFAMAFFGISTEINKDIYAYIYCLC